MANSLEKWQGVIGQEHSLMAPINKLKFKYLNAEWQQVDHADIFKNYHLAEQKCDYLQNVDTVNELACWMDSVNWSLMKQTPVTEDVYQFIAYHGRVIGKSFAELFQEMGGFF